MKLVDCARDTTTTTGSGDIVLSGQPPIGAQSLSAFQIGELFEYKVSSLARNEWEVCVGRRVSALTIRCTEVISSSDGGAKVTFSEGVKDVFATISARRLSEMSAPGRDGVDGRDGVNGQDGRDGVDGQDGTDGLPGRDGLDGRDGIDGKNGLDGAPGIDGKDGADGAPGADGVDGESADLAALPIVEDVSEISLVIVNGGAAGQIPLGLAGITLAQLAIAPSIPDSYLLEVADPSTGMSFSATVAALKSIFGGAAPPADTTGPEFPDQLTSSSVTQTAFTLGWSAATDANGIARYEYSYDGSTWTSVGTALSVNLIDRAPGTTHSMRVRAIDPSGNASTVRTLAVTTAANSGDTQSPSMSGSISTSAITSSGYTFGWAAGSDNVGIVRYETSNDGGATWVSVGTALSRTVTGRPASTTDNLRVRAHDAASNISNVLAASVTTSPASQTQAQKFSTTELASFSSLPSTAQFSGGTAPNQYFTFDFKVLVRALDSTYPAASALRFFWIRTAPNAGVPTSLPASMQFTGGAWPGGILYSANGGTSGNVPNSIAQSGYFNEGGYPAVFNILSQLYAGGAAGDYYIVVGFPDGSFNIVPTKVTVS